MSSSQLEVNYLEKAAKNAAKKAAAKAVTKAATTSGEYIGYNAGDKIVELLSKNKTPSTQMEPNISISPSFLEPKKLTAAEVNDRRNQILSGGKLKRRKFI